MLRFQEDTQWISVSPVSPKRGSIVRRTAAWRGPECAWGVDESAEHQLAGDEREESDENFL